MANVLLISCNVTQEPCPVFPLGMAMVAESTMARGHHVVQWDLLEAGCPEEVSGAFCPEDPKGALHKRVPTPFPTSKRVASEIRSCRPDVIGLSLRNIDNCDSSNLVSYEHTYAELVGILRKHTSSPIVLGGAGYSLFPEVLLERTGADYGIVGEGEASFVRLVDELAGGRPPRQRVLWGDTELPGEAIGPAVRARGLADFYLRQGGMLNLQTKRGCPHRCAYCTYPILEGRTYRFRSPKAVVDEIEMLVTRYQADYYAIADSVFNDRQGRYLAIAEELVRRAISVPWMAFFRPQRFGREEVQLLKRAGLHAVEWGTDCATDATLEGMQKDFTWGEVEESDRLFAEVGIPGAHFIIFGGPGETEQTVQEGLANIERLSKSVVFAFSGVRILPGTAVQRMAVEQGVLTGEQDLLQARFYFSPGVTQQFLHQALRKAFDGRRDRLYPPGRDAPRIRAFHRMGYRGPIWDLLLAGGGRRRRR